MQEVDSILEGGNDKKKQTEEAEYALYLRLLQETEGNEKELGEDEKTEADEASLKALITKVP